MSMRIKARSVGSGTSVSRSEEHTSELQSPCNLVCRLLLEKKKTKQHSANSTAIMPGRTIATSQSNGHSCPDALAYRFVILFCFFFFFFFNDTATTEIYTLSLHDALSIFRKNTARKIKIAMRGGLSDTRTEDWTR